MKTFKQFSTSKLDEAKTGKLSETEFDEAIMKKMAELSSSKIGYKMTLAEIKLMIKRSPTMSKQFGALRTEMLKALNAKRDEKGMNETFNLSESAPKIISMKVSDFLNQFIKKINSAKADITKSKGSASTYIESDDYKKITKHTNSIISTLNKLARGF